MHPFMIMEGFLGSADPVNIWGGVLPFATIKLPTGRLLMQSCYSLITKLRQIWRKVKHFFCSAIYPIDGIKCHGRNRAE